MKDWKTDKISINGKFALKYLQIWVVHFSDKHDQRFDDGKSEIREKWISGHLFLVVGRRRVGIGCAVAGEALVLRWLKFKVKLGEVRGGEVQSRRN